ncbi:MAG TPA: hypothetical protein VFI24_11535 [Pyrinomonadaceae bacterium]|nr:hypothetical protein [Pyrinomonadaceae bacterium]
MLMADTMSIFFVILGMLLAFSGLWLLCRGLWPDAVEAAAARCAKRVWPYFLAGIPLTLVTIVLARTLFVLGPVGKFASVAVVCFYMLQAHTGVSGLATAIGRRLPSPLDERSPWRATLRGGIALELTYLLPILGWFVVLPASIIIGTGAINLALLSRLRIQTNTQPTLVQQAGE